MKKLFGFIAFSLLFLTACRKTDMGSGYIDESQWLQKERAVVVFADYSCNYFVVETRNGYAILENWSLRPFNGDVLYGDFSHWGPAQVYNRTRGSLMQVNVRDFWLSYYEAEDRIYNYCSP